jgi:putative DNA primase/helicase
MREKARGRDKARRPDLVVHFKKRVFDEWPLKNGETVRVSTDNDKKVIAQLAKLDPIEYERRRKAAARLLGVREAALDRCVARERAQASKRAEERNERAHHPKPWPKRVHGAELLDQMVREIGRYLALREGEAEVLGLWAAFTHADDRSFVSPRLWLQSPEPGCGKTTTMDVLYHLVADPLFTVDITAAALFREIDQRRRTVLLDEGDALLDSAKLISLLNSGYETNSASVVRARGTHSTQSFSTFFGAAVATIKPVPPAFASRTIPLRLRRRRPDENVEQLTLGGVKTLRELSRKAARWVLDNKDQILNSKVIVPDFLSNRAADNWKPLLAIADVADGHWPTRAREVAELLATTAGRAKPSRGLMLLADIRDSILTRDMEAISPTELAIKLGALEGRPWGDWQGRGCITPTEIANLLAPYDIEVSKIGGRATYLAARFDDAFARYLPPATGTVTTGSGIPIRTQIVTAMKQVGLRLIGGLTGRHSRSTSRKRTTRARRSKRPTEIKSATVSSRNT